MQFALALKIALRYSHSKSPNALIAFINRFSVLGLIIGVASLIVVLSVMNGLEQQLKERVLSLVPHVELTAQHNPVAPDVLQQLSELPQFASRIDFIEVQALLQSPSQLAGVNLHGVSMSALSEHINLSPYIQQGELSTLQAQRFSVALGAPIARQLNVSVGDTIRVIIPSRSRFTPMGQIPLQKLVNVAAIYSSQTSADEATGFMRLADLQRLSRSETATRIFLQEPFALSRFTSALRNDATLSQQFNIERTWRDRQGAFFDAVRMEKTLMSLMLSLVIAVAAFNIVASLIMVVNEKYPDIAILRTQGLAPEVIVMIFIANGVYNALTGTLLGVGLGLFLVFSLNPVLSAVEAPIALAVNGDPLPMVLGWLDVVVIGLGALLLCVIATIAPSLHALRVNPSAVLQSE